MLNKREHITFMIWYDMISGHVVLIGAEETYIELGGGHSIFWKTQRRECCNTDMDCRNTGVLHVLLLLIFYLINVENK